MARMRAPTSYHRPAMVPADESRMRAVMDGHRDATESLLAELLPRVRNKVRYSLHCDSEVDDITQEALVAILRGLPSYRGDGAFESWADRVAGRVAFAASSRVRAERSQLNLEEEDVELNAVPEEEPSSEDCLLRRQLAKLLEQLSDEQRRVLVLHHVMEMSVPEMAEQLEVPFETIRSRLRLGRAHLRALFLAQFGEEAEP
ncbi:RNA polymerase sigma factor [Stigmatella ashevillensis]